MGNYTTPNEWQTVARPEDEMLMPASEARRKIQELNDATSQRLKRHAKQAIEKAVSQGLTKASLTIDHSHVTRIAEWLRSLGYKVDAGSDQRDGNWFQVSWS